MPRKEWIIFDTNVLLNLYNAQPDIGTQIIEFLMKKLDDIWIPNQVAEEFLKQQESAKRNAMNQSTTFNKRFEEKMSNLDSFLEKSYRSMKTFHFKEIDGLKAELKAKSEEMKDKFKDFSVSNTAEIENRKAYIELVDVFTSNVIERKGDAFNFKELLEIFSEGEMRYKNNIPPGFQDKNKISDAFKKRKGNITIEDLKSGYGDLILWKELLEFSKAVKEDIVFISDDIKSDWCIDKVIRPELVEEFKCYNSEVKVYHKMFMSYLEDSFDGDDGKTMLFINGRRFCESHRRMILEEIEKFFKEVIDTSDWINKDDFEEELDKLDIGSIEFGGFTIESVRATSPVVYDISFFVEVIIHFYDDRGSFVGKEKTRNVVYVELLREFENSILETIKSDNTPRVGVHDFETIHYGDFVEFESPDMDWCDWCGRNAGTVSVSNGNYICETCMSRADDKGYFYCSKCGEVKSSDEDLGGECISCYKNSD